MPTLRVDPAGPDDLFGGALNTVQPTTGNFAVSDSGYGAEYDEKTSTPGVPLEYFVYAEFEVPDGASITGVRFGFTRRSNSGGSVRFRSGIMARDGLWDQTGWNDTNYPLFSNLPHPITRPISSYVYNDSLWHDTRYVESTHATGSSGDYTVGEGGSPTYSIAGFIDFVQGFLEDTTSAHRAFSASGTAVPMLFCFTAGTANTTDSVQYKYSADESVEARRPYIEIDYQFPVSFAIGYETSTFPAASGRSNLKAAASGQAGTYPAASGRVKLGPAATGRAGTYPTATGRVKFR